MATSTTFSKIGDIFQCELVLANGQKFIIPMREDGYIHATALCKIAGKKVNGWLRMKETQKFVEIVEKNFVTRNSPTKNLIEIHQAGNKYNQGTWVHPELGINLAQWCCPDFALQVSRWVRELIITGKVEQGHEKKEEELKEVYESKISTLEQQLLQQKEELEQRDLKLLTKNHQLKYLSKEYEKVYKNHQSFLRRKEVYKLLQGKCLYFAKMREDDTHKKGGYKLGGSGDINGRFSNYRTSNPFAQLLYVIYTDKAFELENIIKLKYDSNLILTNREFIINVPIEELIESTRTAAKMLNLSYTEETQEEIDKFNEHIIKVDLPEPTVEDVLDEKEDIVPFLKRCGGNTHETEESRMLPLNRFFKNSGNSDGVNRICKTCFLTYTYGPGRKFKKIVPIPEFDENVQKWCNMCETVKNRSTDFYKDSTAKDGLNGNCKACKAKQKSALKNKKKMKKLEAVEASIETN
jgi:hypothetical protein